MKDFEENCICARKRLRSRIVWGYQIWCLVFAATLLVACAPGMYSVDMKYVPTRSSPKAKGAAQSTAMTVAAFQDIRKIKDNMLIGRVIKSNGTQIPVLPKFVTPANAVTEPIKDFLRQAGYRVATASPAWDFQESSINKGWGPILVGGSIDDLEVVCQESLTVTKYTAKVRLTVYFADAQKGKIFHKVTTDSSTTLDHVLFSEERLGQQINTALSDAMEKIFEGRDITNIIKEGIRQNP